MLKTLDKSFGSSLISGDRPRCSQDGIVRPWRLVHHQNRRHLGQNTPLPTPSKPRYNEPSTTLSRILNWIKIICLLKDDLLLGLRLCRQFCVILEIKTALFCLRFGKETLGSGIKKIKPLTIIMRRGRVTSLSVPFEFSLIRIELFFIDNFSTHFILFSPPTHQENHWN